MRECNESGSSRHKRHIRYLSRWRASCQTRERWRKRVRTSARAGAYDSGRRIGPKRSTQIRRGEHGADPRSSDPIGLSRPDALRCPSSQERQGQGEHAQSAEYAFEAGQAQRETHRRPRVSRAVSRVLKHEPRSTASRAALSHMQSAPPRRTRVRALCRATQGRGGRRVLPAAQQAARKAARTRTRRLA